MPAQIKVGGVWKTLTGIQIKVGGVWKSLTRGQVKVGGVWKEFFAVGGGGGGGGGGGSITVNVTINPVVATKSGTSASGYVSSTTGTVPSAVGATGSVTYSWARVSAADSFSGGFTRLGTNTSARWGATVNDGTAHVETWRVTGVDSVGASGYRDVVVNLAWEDTDGGYVDY